MKFSFESVPLKSKPHNENFYFDVAMPSGHFFTVLNFASHDFANLNAALRGKLETIVGSFSSLPDFSDDLFLGFLAKELNNFVSNLAQQSGDLVLPFSTGMCLVSGNRFSYFLAGDVVVRIPGLAELVPAADAPQSLGKAHIDAPLTDDVQELTLKNSDVVMIMTRSVADAFSKSPDVISSADPRQICESLIKASAEARDDRTVVVLCGPFEEQKELSATYERELSEIQTSLASLKAKLEQITIISPTVDPQLTPEIDALKNDLRSKASTIDMLEVQEQLKEIKGLIAGKADTTSVLALERDVLKLGLSVPVTSDAGPAAKEEISSADINSDSKSASRSFGTAAAVAVVLLSLAAGVAGGWLFSRLARKPSESWLVETASDRIVISRVDASGKQDVTLPLSQPTSAAGVQKFSSFADVKNYVETIRSSSAQSNNATTSKSPAPVTEIKIKVGDSLKKLAQNYNVPEEKIRELNPTITRWETVRVGQAVIVPAVASIPTPAPTQPEPAASNQSPTNTAEITVGPGDSLNELARRFNTTAAKLRELNPNFNWPRIQAGQKVVVPAAGG